MVGGRGTDIVVQQAAMHGCTQHHRHEQQEPCRTVTMIRVALSQSQPTTGTPADPSADSSGNINIIAEAVRRGVKKFVLVTSIGTGDSRDAPPEKVYDVLAPVLLEKEKAEAYLKVRLCNAFGLTCSDRQRQAVTLYTIHTGAVGIDAVGDCASWRPQERPSNWVWGVDHRHDSVRRHHA